MSRPKLNNVTLCAVTARPELTLRALKICADACDFDDIVMVSPMPSPDDYIPIRIVEVHAEKTAEWYDACVLRVLPDHINTSHALIIQWDSWIVNPEVWTDDFLNYDYIGPRWPWQPEGCDVGCGGFSLRSINLMRAVKNLLPSWPIPPDSREDDLICRGYRPMLEKLGLTFAPGWIADRFAYEYAKSDKPSFGFHDMRNFHAHCSRAEMLRLIPALPAYIVMGSAYDALMTVYRQSWANADDQAILRVMEAHKAEVANR